MPQLPKDKVGLYVYVSPKCKEKLDCLSKLYRSAGRKFSLGDIVEESINIIYAAAYLCQDSKFWKGFFKVSKVLDTSEASNQGIDDVLTIIQKNKTSAKKLLKVPVNFRENLVKEFNKVFSKSESAKGK
jgi:hypothetical protein